MTTPESPEEGKLAGPVYDSWPEAMADPDLDLSKPFFVGSRDTGLQVAPPNWDGWQRLGTTDETQPFTPEER